MTNPFGFLPVISSLHDESAIESLVGPYLRMLEAMGGQRRSKDDLLHAPLGNHVLVLPGHYAARLEVWWKNWNLPRAASTVR